MPGRKQSAGLAIGSGKHFMDGQLSLFEGIDEATETAFRAYHQSNPHIYEWFKRFAFEKIRRGSRRVGSKAIFERLRWESPAIATGEFKINNNFTAPYARLFMKEYPEHRGVFATRRARADIEGVE